MALILELAGALQSQARSQTPIRDILNHEIPQILLFTPKYVAHVAAQVVLQSPCKGELHPIAAVGGFKMKRIVGIAWSEE